MAISRKHFRAIANAVNRTQANTVEMSYFKLMIARQLSYALADNSDSFKPEVFIDACLSPTDKGHIVAIKALERN